jgi:hypothetical protein
MNCLNAGPSSGNRSRNGWLDVRRLVEDEAVFRVFLQELECAQDVGQADLQIFLAGLEDGALPVRVRNDVEDRLEAGVIGVGRESQ